MPSGRRAKPNRRNASLPSPSARPWRRPTRISSEGVVHLIGELKSTMTRTLTQLSDRLEEEIGKYGRICRAIAAKESELKEIYEIQRSASTLLAFLETHERKQEEMERDLQAEKEQLDREIETTRVEWDKERRQHEQEIKERDAAEQKRRQREAGGIQVQLRPRTAACSGSIGR